MVYCTIMSARGPKAFPLSIAKTLGTTHGNRISGVHKQNAKEVRHPKESSFQHKTDPLTFQVLKYILFPFKHSLLQKVIHIGL